MTKPIELSVFTARLKRCQDAHASVSPLASCRIDILERGSHPNKACGRPSYGYEITAWLRDQGFSDIAEGTVYALLVRIELRRLVDVQKIPSEQGPPRKVYSLNAEGQAYLEEFWRTWGFLAERREQLREGGV